MVIKYVFGYNTNRTNAIDRIFWIWIAQMVPFWTESELKEAGIMVGNHLFSMLVCVISVELRGGDMLKFGYSTRSYVLMNENTVDIMEPEEEEDNEVKSDNEEDLNKMV